MRESGRTGLLPLLTFNQTDFLFLNISAPYYHDGLAKRDRALG